MQTVTLSKFIDGKYAISLDIAGSLVKERKIPVDVEEVIIDFDGIEVVSTPFLRVFLSGINSKVIKQTNANELISEKWDYIMTERDSGIDIDAIIEELEENND